jgi:hypothetical protein
MGRGVREGLWSAGGLGVVLLVLTFVDERVRSRLSAVIDDPVQHGVTFGARLGDLATTIGVVMQEQLASNAALAVFAVVAVFLVWFMVRS